MCQKKTASDPSLCKKYQHMTQFQFSLALQMVIQNPWPTIKPSISSNTQTDPPEYRLIIRLKYETETRVNVDLHIHALNV